MGKGVPAGVVGVLAVAGMWTADAAADPGTELATEIPVTAPWFEPRVTTPQMQAGGLNYHEPGTLFINFDGADMMNCNGSENPVMNCSSIMNDTVLPYSGGASSRAAVVQAMAADVSGFAMEVTEQRPPDDVEYDMVMVGNWMPPPEEGGFAGVAPSIDCDNYFRRETSFSLDLGSPSVVAKIVGQEAAHVWGLEHVDSRNDLLYPTTSSIADPAFENVCNRIVRLESGSIQETDSFCPDQHAINCPDQPHHQNSFLDMFMIFGPPTPDITPPALEIVAPEEGEEFPSGASVDVVIQMEENIPPQLFTVFANIDVDERGSQVGIYPSNELTLPVNGLADGEHLVRVDAEDVDGNAAHAVVSFVIGEAASDDAQGGSGGIGDDGDGEGDGGEDGGTGGEDSGGGAEDDAGGCGCQAPGGPAAWWLLIPLAAVSRGRRARGR